MSGCGQGLTPEPGTSSGSTSSRPSDAEVSALLRLNENLKTQLGGAYSDSWIEGATLHVAVTTEAAKKIVADAGAIPTLVTFDAAQLEAALASVAAWQATLPAEQSAAIHQIIPDGRTGTVTIYVAPLQLDAVAAAAAADKPAGAIPLVIKESAGLATPL